METIVIYHGGCRDGFCAAWVYNKYSKQQLNKEIVRLGETGGPTFDLGRGPTYHPGFYGQEPPDVKGKNVIILDFCYPLEVMKEIMKQASSLKWIDHHKTAQPFADFLRSIWGETEFPEGCSVEFVFRNDKSGAGLTWDYFFPNEPRPWLVDYVEDRDLWAKKLFASNAVNAYISCLKFDFAIWDIVNNETSISQAVGFGQIAEMKTEQYVREVCKNVYFTRVYNEEELDTPSRIIYENIPTVNICQVDCSEVLHELCKLYPVSPFSLYWFKRHDGMYQYGLRSIGDFDVSSVAKLFGGGGHKNAAGFQLNYLLEELK